MAPRRTVIASTADRRITLPLPAELAEQVDAWRDAFEEREKVRPSQVAALLALIMGGLEAGERTEDA